MKKLTTCLLTATFIMALSAPLYKSRGFHEVPFPDDLAISANDLEDVESARKKAQESLIALRQAQQDEILAKGKQHGLNAIDQRLLSIENARNRINANEKISSDHKNTILNNFANAEAGLNGLKNQIQNESDLDQLRTQVQNIFYNYRVYAIELPKDHGLLACGVIDYLINDKLATVYEKLDEIVAVLKEEGKDTSTLENLITEFKGYVSAAETDLEAARAEFNLALPAEDMAEAKAHILAAREHLISARSNLRLAKETLKKIAEEVRSLKAS